MSAIEGIMGSTGDMMGILNSGVVGKDDFLKMMIAQLKNQDPLNPLDGTDFTAQLAQFSSLEQLSNMNSQLEVLGMYQSSLNNAQSVSLIGREVTAHGDSVTIEGETAGIPYRLSEYADSVAVSIYDDEGRLVDTIETGSQDEGDHSITWDCGDVAPGSYTFSVSATDAAGEAVPVDTLITGRVTGVTFREGFPFLSVAGHTIPLGDVLFVNETVL